MSGKGFPQAKRINWLLLLILGVFLSGCSAKLHIEQPALTNEVTLSAENPVGQTFVARYDGLSGIYFALSPGEAGDGEIRLHLRADPQSTEDLAISYEALPINTIQGPGQVGFFIPAQAGSSGQYRYAFLEVTGSGSVEVGSGPGDSYLGGALCQNHTPNDAQATFDLSYSRWAAALGLAGEGLRWGGMLLIGAFLFCLPGWGLLSVLLPTWNTLHWAEKLGLSAGLSLAVYPILLLVTNLVGLHLGAAYAWIPPILGGYLLFWRNGDELKAAWQRIISWRNQQSTINNQQSVWPDLTLVVILLIVIFTRFWAIRSLEAPMWGDGYQHTLITQLLVDHSGLFTSWEPYIELATFTYHFGFHSTAAAFHWLSGIDVAQATLWTGQILNVLAILALYPLATRAAGSRWAGVVAVLVAGLLSSVPMVYVNWSRYTQLAGQIIVLAAVWLAWEILESEKITWRVLALGWLAWGGLALTHYRVLIMGGVFILAYWVLHLRRSNGLAILKKSFGLGIGSVLLFLPWFLGVYGGKILRIFNNQITRPAQEINAAVTDPLSPLTSYLPVGIWLLLVAAVVWLLWRQNKPAALISLWAGGVYLAANPQWLGLPGNGSLGNNTVLIAVYIPASLLIGIAASQFETILTRLSGRWLTLVSGLTAGLLLVIGLTGANLRIGESQPNAHALLTRPDVRATAWLQENTPPESRILVNSFFAFGNTVIVGSDGGWWLPLMAQRQTTLPPINYTFEQGARPGYAAWVNLLTAEIQAKGLDHPDVLAMLTERQITYVYLGQRQGSVNSGGALLQTEQLLASPNFTPIYHQDRVWIFERKSADGNQ